VRFLAAACALLSLIQTASPPAAQAVQILLRHFDPADRESARYHYVAFDVADGTERLTINYRYNGDDGTNVIDLGLFQPGSLALGSAAFRGYSGGARRTIFVGREASSPGYRTGPLPPGRWHVLLGLYKVAPGGVDVTVEVTATNHARPSTEGDDNPGSPATFAAPAARDAQAGRRWYSGALHLHTTHSDGTLSPASLADAVRSAGFDFFAVTDHNNTTHSRESLPGVPLHIVGEEVTTPAGHANVWGLPADAWIDFRVRQSDPGAARAIDALVAEASRAGALVAINHPVDTCAGCSWEHEVPAALDAIEIWNGGREPQQPAIAIWDRLLRSGRRVTAVGASDWHRAPAPIDTPAVRVLADSLTQADILDAIRQSRVIVVRDTRVEPPSVRATCGSSTASIGETLVCGGNEHIAIHVGTSGTSGGRAELFWNGDRSKSKPASNDVAFEVRAAAGYLRVHLFAADGSTAAITNPIHVAIR